jgi:hypothetical protein
MMPQLLSSTGICVHRPVPSQAEQMPHTVPLSGYMH